MTLFLCWIGWQLLKSRYLSVCVGFLYIEKLNLPTMLFVIFKSRKFIDEFSSLSTVNYMELLTLLIMLRVLSIASSFRQAITSSTYRYQKSILSWIYAIMDFSMFCITISAITTETGDPIGVPFICWKYSRLKEKWVASKHN